MTRKMGETALQTGTFGSDPAVLYKRLFQAVHDAVLIADDNERLVDANAGACRLLGYSRKELLGMSVRRTIMEEPVWRQFIRTGRLRGEFLLRRRDGRLRNTDIQATAHVIPGRHLMVFRDVTRQKRAPQGERSMRRHLQAILKSIDGGLLVLNKRMRIIEINQTAERLFGCKSGDIVGKQIFSEAMTGLKSSLFEEMAVQAMHKKSKREFKFCFGAERDEDCYRVFMFPVEAGITVFLIAEAQCKKPSRIRKTGQHFRQFFEMEANFCYLVDSEGTIRDVNRSALTALGYKKKELIGKPLIQTIYAPGSRAKAGQLYERWKQTGKLEQQELYIRKKTGEIRIVLLSAGVLLGEKGAIRHSFIIQRDITQEKKNEQELMDACEASAKLLQDLRQEIKFRKKAEEDLQKHDLELRQTLDATTDGIWTWNFSTNRLVFSPKYYTMLGYRPDAFPADFEHWAELIHPEDRKGALKTAENYLKTKPETYVNEFRLRTRTGGYRWIHAHARVVERDKAGNAVLMIGNHEDVTERKQTEQALREMRDRAQAYLDLAGVIFVGINRKGKVQVVNQKAVEMLGYAREEILGRNWFNTCIPSGARTRVRHVFKQLMNGEIGAAEYVENMVVTNQGKKHLIAWHNSVLRNKLGEITGTLSSGEDVTELRNAQAALLESKLFYEEILENIQDGILVTDKNDRIYFVNRSMETIVGIKREKLYGYNILHDFPESTAGVFNRYYHKAKRMRAPVWYEVPIKMPAGRDTYQNGWLVPRIINSRYMGMICTMRDITTRKQTEQQLERERHLFKILMDTMPDHIYFKDKGSRFFVVNKAQAARFGLHNPDEAIGKTDFDFFSEEHARQAFEDEQRIIRTGEPLIGIEERETWAGQFDTWVSTTKMPLMDSSGKITGTFGISRDITMHKHAEQQIRNYSQFLDTIMDLSPFAMWISDTEGTIQRTNKSLRKLLNLRDDQILGKYNILKDRNLIDQKVMPQVTGVFQQAKPARFTLNWLPEKAGDFDIKESNSLWIDVSIFPILDEAGHFVNTVCQWVDITERRNAEEQIRLSLREKEVLLRELYHRTKNNMQIICSMLRLKGRAIHDEALNRILREIENKIQAMALVHRKLYESQDLSSLNLTSYFKDLILLVQNSYFIDTHRIRIHYEAEHAIPVLIDTAVPLGLVLNELLSNSIKHAFPETNAGDIYVRLKVGKRQEIVLEFQDNGIGLPESFNIDKHGNLGLQTVMDLARYQLRGNVTLKNQNGCYCRILLKKELYQSRV
ncbi:PAS domain S-box protein [bacterium]|nr:PAS domain S-box protein [bacterium]